MKYITCQLCGAHLDFGEKCTCRAEAAKYENKIASLIKSDKNGQLRFVIGKV
jgi:hypothetical protein